MVRTDPYDRLISRVYSSPCLFTEINGKRVTWEVYGACNLRCAHCCVSAENKCSVVPNIDKYRRIIKQLADDGVKAIYISGGEPLLWKDIYDFISYAKENGIELISLATNGTLLSRENVKKLERAGLDKILISLDHYVPSLHDKLRGVQGAFEIAIKGLENVRRYSNIYIRVGSIIWKENYKDLERFINFLISKEVDEVIFSWIIKTGRAVDNPDIFVDKKYYFEIAQQLEILKNKYSDFIKVSFHRFRKLDKSSENCKGGEKFYYINYLGQLGPCSWISKLLPEKYLTKNNLFEKDLQTLKSSKEFADFIKDKNERYKKFGPGCPAICAMENGSIFSKDPLFEE